MNVILYALAAYLAMAAISLAVVGVIVLVNRLTASKGKEDSAP